VAQADMDNCVKCDEKIKPFWAKLVRASVGVMVLPVIVLPFKKAESFVHCSD
jgi:hypothetical protein